MLRRNLLLTLSLGVILACSAPLAAAETHPFSIHDMLAMDRISDAQVSPDGTQVAFVRPDDRPRGEPRRATDLWLARRDGEGRAAPDDARGRRLEPPLVRRRQERSSSSRRAAGSPQVWRLPLDGGEAEQVTGRAARRRQPRGRPGRRGSSSSRWRSSPGRAPAETKKALDEQGAGRRRAGCSSTASSSATGTPGRTARRNHLFACRPGRREGRPGPDAGDGRRRARRSRSAAPRRSPSPPTARRSSSRRKDVGREEAWSTNFDLFDVPDRRLGRPEEDHDQPGLGRHAALLARRQDAGLPRDEPRPATRPTASRSSCATWRPARSARSRCAPTTGTNGDRSPAELAWSADGKTLYATADHLGQQALFAIDAATGKARIVVGEGTVDGPQPARRRTGSSSAVHSLLGPDRDLHRARRRAARSRSVTPSTTRRSPRSASASPSSSPSRARRATRSTATSSSRSTSTRRRSTRSPS